MGMLYTTRAKETGNDNKYILSVDKTLIDYKGNTVKSLATCEFTLNIAHIHVVSHVSLVETEGVLHAVVFIVDVNDRRIKKLYIYCLDEITGLICVLNIPEESVLLTEIVDGCGQLTNCSVKVVGKSTIALFSKKLLYVHDIRKGTQRNPAVVPHSVKNIKYVWTSKPKVVAPNHKLVITLIVSASLKTLMNMIHIKANTFEVTTLRNLLFYFPTIYTPVIESMTLNIDSVKTDNTLQDGVSVACNTVFMTTSKKQLLKISNGKVISCTALPIAEVTHILQMSNCLGDNYLVLKSKSGCVCVVNEEQKVSTSL